MKTEQPACELSELLRAVASSDADALAELYRRLELSVYGFAMSRLGDREQAAEVLPDTLAAEDRQWAHETGGLLGRLHFAAHALVDDQRPRRSAVLLAAGGTEEDGLLQPREIAALDLEGKLVVVSACESGSGQVLLGEGVQSLARAFFRAGARAVVASLWRLEDDEAAEFFDLFYRALADGESVAGALAHARRERSRDGAPAAAWAGVVALGDGAMVPVPGGVGLSAWWSLLWISMISAALWWAWRHARRRPPSPT